MFLGKLKVLLIQKISEGRTRSATTPCYWNKAKVIQQSVYIASNSLTDVLLGLTKIFPPHFAQCISFESLTKDWK